MFSHILGLEAWKSAEFMKVRSMRSRATAREAEPFLWKAMDARSSLLGRRGRDHEE